MGNAALVAEGDVWARVALPGFFGGREAEDFFFMRSFRVLDRAG